MSAISTIETAAQEIIAGIEGGATLPFSPGVLEALRETYYDRLERAELLGIHWSAAKDRVLPFAYMVGAVATMLAIADQALTRLTDPLKQVLPEHAWGAAYLVSKVCQYPMDGKICCDMPRDNVRWHEDQDPEMVGGLLKIFRILNLVSDSPNSTQVSRASEQTSSYPPPGNFA